MKRILTLDGGGIRGVFSLQILRRLEAIFREEQRRDDLVLADVFHLFAGTSTGAIIATCLAWGMPVREIEELYLTCASGVFTKERWYRRWKAKYRAAPIAEFLRQSFSEAEHGPPALLGSKRLRTLLLIVMRNASTGSPWPVSNNPRARYNDASLPDCNLKIPLWQLLRASTAAPFYFPPEAIRLGDQTSLFVDGGMTPFNNPSLIAVLMATLAPYQLCWPAGRELLHVISIGTCAAQARLPHKVAAKINLLDEIRYVAPAWVGTMSAEQDLLCRVLGDCVYGAPLDSEIGTLDVPTLLGANEQKFTYVRYDQAWNAEHSTAAGLSGLEAELDDVKPIPVLQRIGQEYASEHVRLEHLFPRRPVPPTEPDPPADAPVHWVQPATGSG